MVAGAVAEQVWRTAELHGEIPLPGTMRLREGGQSGTFSLSQKLRSGEVVFSAWCRLGIPLLSEMIASSQSFGAITFDQQHGLFDFSSTHLAIAAMQASRVAPVVRVPVGDFSGASRMLDSGAEAIIAPMINSIEDAEALVAATKYPPLGRRSWGPHRALQQSSLNETQYLQSANALTLTFAMLETRAGIRNAAAILDVPGIDGAFVGPSDLCITLSEGTQLNPSHPEVDAALDIVAALSRSRGKISGASCATADRAVELSRRGYQFLGVSSDAVMFNIGMQATARTLAVKQNS